MSVQYSAIGWNRQKKFYDLVLVSTIVLYLGTFIGVGAWLNPNATAETLLIRGLGTAGFLLLNLILCIGPLARLDSRFLPLLYNRRHLGVTTFLLGLAHGGFALFQFHALGNENPLVSLFISNPRYGSVAEFPFQVLGFFALMILFLMAATSHDFWLRNLSAPAWKRLHMLVYVAYTLLVAHVALGALQSETSPLWAFSLIAPVAIVMLLHLMAAFRERQIDQAGHQVAADGFVEVCRAGDIPEKGAKIISLSGERVAVFSYDGKISAISNVCQHQNGPLGEGRIIDGCITCPWHGYQYQPESGASPAPFKEKVPTFLVKVVEGRVWVHPQPNAPGTYVEPAPVGPVRPESAPELIYSGSNQEAAKMSEFYVGYAPNVPPRLARLLRRTVIALGLVASAVALVLVSAQKPFANSIFEFGKVRNLEGVVVAKPYPALLVSRPGETAFAEKDSQYLLVAPGKFGADGLVAGFEGQRVRLQGQLIYRDGGTMVEIAPGSISTVGGSPATPETTSDLGPITATGEIVDSKCYLGVMNPGNGKVHRDCAARCLSGGIPPIFVTANGPQYLLVGPDGAAIGHDALREFIAEPITIRGELLRRGDSPFIRIDPRSLRHGQSVHALLGGSM